MRKANRIMMGTVSILLCLVLVTTSVLSGIFAKYVTNRKAEANVAFKKWGITVTPGSDLEDSYSTVIDGEDRVVVSSTLDGNLMAPGTRGSLAYLHVKSEPNDPPEVRYELDFDGEIDIGFGFWSTKSLIEEKEYVKGELEIKYPTLSSDEIDAKYDELLKIKSEIAFFNESGAETGYFPIQLKLRRFDLNSDGSVNTNVMSHKLCLVRLAPNAPKGASVYSANDGPENDYTPYRWCFYGGNSSYGDMRMLENDINERKYHADGEELNYWNYYFNENRVRTDVNNLAINSIYAVEWDWLYHYDTVEEAEANSGISNRYTHTPTDGSPNESAVGDYQTAELDTQLGEAVAKVLRDYSEYSDLFNIKLDMSVSVNQIEISEDEPADPEDPVDPEDPADPEVPVNPYSVDINWKDLYDARLMRSQWWTDIGQAQNDYDSKFTVKATDTELTSAPNDKGADRTYFSTKMYEITSDTRYEYTFEAKNNLARGYAGVIFAYDITGKFPYLAFGEFDNISDKGSCIHLAFKKGHFNTGAYPACAVGWDEFTKVVKQTDDGYGQYKVIYDGFDVKFCYLDTSGEYVQLGSTITLPAGSKVCVGVYSPVINEKCYTVSLRNCVLTAKNDETIGYLVGQNISLVKTFNVKVATFNICKAEYGATKYKDYTKIVAAIKASGAEIIGLQEVDYRTKRTGYVDQAAEIARLAGYEYFWTFPAIEIQGGSFGVAIISKYPIGRVEQINLPSGTGEQRILARAGITVHNEVINFFVTHLSYNGEQGTNRAEQFAAVANKIANYKNVILTGDFNTEDWPQFNPIVNKGFLLVSKSDSDKTGTHYVDGYGYLALDNIVHSKIFTSSGRNFIDNGASDHRLLYATLTYRE